MANRPFDRRGVRRSCIGPHDWQLIDASSEVTPMATKKNAKPPWEKSNPRKKRKKLTTQAKSAAKKRAKRAGRKYPNLVDNMHAASAQKNQGRRTSKLKEK